MQEKGCKFPHVKQWLVSSSQVLKTKIQNPNTEMWNLTDSVLASSNGKT